MLSNFAKDPIFGTDRAIIAHIEWVRSCSLVQLQNSDRIFDLTGDAIVVKV